MALKRLSKVAREFNVGISTIVEFLNKKGIQDIEANPNTKISEDIYSMLDKEYSKDVTVKKESEKVSEQRHQKRQKHETVVLSEGPHEQVDLDAKEEKKKEEAIVSRVPERPEFKVVDKIDLDAKGNPKVVKTEEVAEEAAKVVPTEEPKKEQKEEPKEVAPKVEEVKEVKEEEKPAPVVASEPVEAVEAPKEEMPKEKTIEPEAKPVVEEPVAKDSAPEEPTQEDAKEESDKEVNLSTNVKLKSNIKVVDKIDLSSLNQRTRPPKKTKEEKRKARIEKERGGRKEVKPRTAEDAKGQQGGVYKASKVKLNGPKVVDKINLPEGSTDSDGVKRKRKRIIKEKVNVQKTGDNAAKGPRKGVQKRVNIAKKGGKRPVKPEITEQDIQKQIKDTLARLTNKGKSKGAKYRREKRDAVSEKQQAEMEKQLEEQKNLKLTEFVTANDLSSMMDVSVTDIISTCMNLGLFVSINQRLDAETITIVADEYNYKVEFVSADVQESITSDEDDLEDTDARPPIVTVMGHVDHGKTSLLDYVRSANVIAGEAGGITQHIGAYNVTLEDGRKITFLDTPGHEAFTAMRARGAQVTDIAIIIVAADDDVMPQTIEAINHAAAAGVPMVFAINKIDKPGANVEKIKEQLANMNYLVEDWGGKYQSQEISAKHGKNIEELLEKVLLESEMLELKANPEKRAAGSIIESSLDRGRGYVATVLVQNGSLKVGDVILAGAYHGHVKAMFNERGQRIEKAGPAEPVLILGLNGAPTAGDNFNVMESEKEARDIANKREQLQREQGLRTQKHITLDEIGRRIAIGNFQELNVIIKGDVDGSIEALADSLIKLSTEEIQVNVIHKAVGGISESDIMLAAASEAIIIGFQVRPSVSARKLAEQEEIDIRLYSIIYDAIEELKSAMEGMLSPEIKEEITSTVEIRETFKITKVGTIAGCMVKEGKIMRNNKIRLIRDGIVVYTGTLGSLKRYKDDVKEVRHGYECGLNISGYNDIKIGDIVESFEQVEVDRKL